VAGTSPMGGGGGGGSGGSGGGGGATADVSEPARESPPGLEGA